MKPEGRKGTLRWPENSNRPSIPIFNLALRCAPDSETRVRSGRSLGGSTEKNYEVFIMNDCYGESGVCCKKLHNKKLLFHPLRVPASPAYRRRSGHPSDAN